MKFTRVITLCQFESVEDGGQPGVEVVGFPTPIFYDEFWGFEASLGQLGSLDGRGGGEGGGHGSVGSDDVRGSLVVGVEVGDVVAAEVDVVLHVVVALFGEGCHMVDVILLDCLVECFSEEQNGVAGRRLRLVIGGWICVSFIQDFVQVADVICICWKMTNHASL